MMIPAWILGIFAAIIWVVGEALGTVFTGGGTDPNSGPLLALLALAYWPVRAVAASSPGAASHSSVQRDEGVPA